MALVHETLSGYLDDDYLSGPYLGGTNGVHLPSQFEVVIVDKQKPTNAQFEAKITVEKDTNSQFEVQILDNLKDTHGQFESKIVDSIKDTNVQFESVIVFNKDTPAQFIKTGIVHRICQGYLEGGYLEEAYLTSILCASLHSQFEVKVVDSIKDTGVQFECTIADFEKDTGVQFESKIIDFQRDLNAQFNASIIDRLNSQFTVVIYNITATRVLCDFLSRGLPVAQGGTGGQNWTAKIGAVDVTKPGDFSPNNLNTDIVEQRWESTTGSISNVNLDVDTEIAQGVTIDTLAILDHNVSPGGTITLQGANDAAFSVVNTTISLPVTEENIFYIAPIFPTSADQNRYWRFNINDPLNSDNFLRVGTIIFGNAVILSEAGCITDRIKRTNTHFADRIRTEGFTTVSNDRALKRKVDMRFENIKFGLGDFEKLDDIFRTARTSLKCLWIPVPQIPSRFAAFAKIITIPVEEHNVKSRSDVDLDLITFNLSVDESL